MKCDHCHKNDATIHLSQTISGITSEQHLCSDCAAELGLNSGFKPFVDEWFKSGAGNTQSIFDTAGGIPAFGSPVTHAMVCPVCGQRYDEFRRSGLLGCSNCYEAFGDRLDAIFRRVQGGSRHTGRKAHETAQQQEIQLFRHKLVELKQQLQQFVTEEEYEKAAAVRDEIKSVQQQVNELIQKEGEDT